MYYYIIFIFITFFSLGARGFRTIPFVTGPSLPAVFEILFIIVLGGWFLKKEYKKVDFNNVPIKNILILFLIVWFVSELRLFFSDAQNSDKLEHIRTLFVFISFPWILSISKYNNSLRIFYKIIVYVLVIVSFSYILIFFVGVDLPGQRDDSSIGGRIIWGGMGISKALYVMILIATYKKIFSKRVKKYIIVLIFLSLLAMFISQSRVFMLFFLISPIVFFFLGGSTLFLRKILVFSTLLILFITGAYFLSITFPSESERFLKQDDVMEDSGIVFTAKDPTRSTYRWIALAWTIYINDTIPEMLFGQGAEFKDQNYRSHIHSGLGYIYGSMGIIGVVIYVILMLKIIIVYKKYINNYRNINEVIIGCILSYLIFINIMSPVAGYLIQSYNIFGQGFFLGIMEICRRNLLQQKS